MQSHHSRFTQLTYLLNENFPNLDLHFNHTMGSNTIRLYAPNISEQILELEIDAKPIDEIVTEATFAIKELAQLFDA